MHIHYHKIQPFPCLILTITCILVCLLPETSYAASFKVENLMLSELSSSNPHRNEKHPSELKERQLDIDMALDILIKYLILVLDDPTTEDISASQGGETLTESVNILILGYPFYGIAPDLTLSEIEIGLENANDIIDLLDKSQNEISLDIGTLVDLRETVESVIVGLNNVE